MKNGIDSSGDERFYSFLTIDMPISKKQLENIRDEIQDHFDNYASDFDKWVWDTCEGVDYDGYGSFRFEWPAEVMNFLAEDQRQRMEEVVNEVACNTDTVLHMCYLHSYNEGEIEINDASDVENYIDAIIEAGYSVCNDDADIVPDNLKEAFNLYLAQLKLTQEVA
jgi:hypothetical protein